MPQHSVQFSASISVPVNQALRQQPPKDCSASSACLPAWVRLRRPPAPPCPIHLSHEGRGGRGGATARGGAGGGGAAGGAGGVDICGAAAVIGTVLYHDHGRGVDKAHEGGAAAARLGLQWGCSVVLGARGTHAWVQVHSACSLSHPPCSSPCPTLPPTPAPPHLPPPPPTPSSSPTMIITSTEATHLLGACHGVAVAHHRGGAQGVIPGHRGAGPGRRGGRGRGREGGADGGDRTLRRTGGDRLGPGVCQGEQEQEEQGGRLQQHVRVTSWWGGPSMLVCTGASNIHIYIHFGG